MAKQPKRLRYTDGSATVLVSPETAVNLGPEWKQVGKTGRTTTRARSTRTPAKQPPKKPAKKPAPQVEPVPVDTGQPSEPVDPEAPNPEWTVEQLRDFAIEHDIDLGEAVKHADILEAITEALAAGLDADGDEGDQGDIDDETE